MCGRAYGTFTDEELQLRYENKKAPKIPKFKPNYNLAPSQEWLVVRHDEKGLPQLDLFRWGLVPFWAKDVKIGYKMINARAETIIEKPSFRKPFERHRCIVPVSGFYEWKRDDEKNKRPFEIHLKKEPIMSLAGIWERWTDPETKKDLHTFSLITTEANSFMGKIHDRMPVILCREDENEWLDPKNTDSKKLARLLKPCPSAWLEAHEISTLVNSPKNNSKEVLEPCSSS